MAITRCWSSHSYETKARWRVRNDQGQQQGRLGFSSVEPASPCRLGFPQHRPSVPGFPLTPPASPFQEAHLPLRKRTPASRGNVQKRKWKMSTSQQADKRRKTSCQFQRLWAVTGFQVSLGLCPLSRRCVPHNNTSFLITSNHKYCPCKNKCRSNTEIECNTHNEGFLHMLSRFLALER